MLSVGLVFVALAGISFLGFAINALFGRIRMTNVVPLMLIGILIGPVLGFVSVGPNGIIAQLTPFVTAIAIAFILFDVGLNINIDNLDKVAVKGNAFAFAVQITTALSIAAVSYFAFSWNPMVALILGFALSSSSTAVVQSIVKVVKVPDAIKTILVYESVATDALALIVPLILINLLVGGNATYAYGFSMAFTVIVGAAVLGAVSALFWLYVLTKFEKQSKGYMWILTMTMLVATYGIADVLGLNTAITIFVFGITFATLGTLKDRLASDDWIAQHFTFSVNMKYIRNYQKEITFFTSTFFFVYIGMLFAIGDINAYVTAYAVTASLIILAVRYALAPIIGGYMSKDMNKRSVEKGITSFSLGRGLSPAVIATVPITLGLLIPNFLDAIFLVILFTNMISTMGVFLETRKTGGFQATLRSAAKN